MTNQVILDALKAPFDPNDIEWRIQQGGITNGNPWALVVPYITSRAVQERLDEVVPLSWENVQKPTPDGKGYLCGITIHLKDRSITRWDGAEYTNIEPLKGALSDSMKRAAVQFGIGRYLYQLDAFFADCSLVDNRKQALNAGLNYHEVTKKGQGNRREKQGAFGWSRPQLPSWAVPTDNFDTFIKAIASSQDGNELKKSYKEAVNAGKLTGNPDHLKVAKFTYDSTKTKLMDSYMARAKACCDELCLFIDNETEIYSKLPNEETVKNYHSKVLAELSQKIIASEFKAEYLKPAKDYLENKLTSRLAEIGKQNEH